MPKGNGRGNYQALPEKYRAFLDAVAKEIPSNRIFCNPFRTLAYGTDASFYRLIPKIVVKVRAPEEVVMLLRTADRLSVPVTFRAAGTSLSGRAVTDSVLAVLAGGWRKHRILGFPRLPGRLLQQPDVRDRPHARERTAVPVDRLPRGPVLAPEGAAGITHGNPMCKKRSVLERSTLRPLDSQMTGWRKDRSMDCSDEEEGEGPG